MKIYIVEDESYPVYFFKKSEFYDGDKPCEISQEKYDWVVSVAEEYETIQKFLGNLIKAQGE